MLVQMDQASYPLPRFIPSMPNLATGAITPNNTVYDTLPDSVLADDLRNDLLSLDSRES